MALFSTFFLSLISPQFEKYLLSNTHREVTRKFDLAHDSQWLWTRTNCAISATTAFEM